MALFNRKTLKRQAKPVPLPPEHRAALESWGDMIRDGRVYALKEVALHGQFAGKISKSALGYRDP